MTSKPGWCRSDQWKWFSHWMRERHQIYLNREQGLKWPWTKDKILQQYKFTNVFRQLDRVTVELNDLVGRQIKGKEWEEVVYHWLVARLFCWPPTYSHLVANKAVVLGPRGPNVGAVYRLLEKLRANGSQIFTGAYIITNGGVSAPKTALAARAMVSWRDRVPDLAAAMKLSRSVEMASKSLATLDMMGAFTAYEVACDLMYVRGGPLYKAADRETWANPGPGARRGINRLRRGEPKVRAFRQTEDYVHAMRELLACMRHPENWPYAKWPLEMREIEHSLCEFDKYMRVKRGEGRPRSRYRAPEGE